MTQTATMRTMAHDGNPVVAASKGAAITVCVSIDCTTILTMTFALWADVDA